MDVVGHKRKKPRGQCGQKAAESSVLVDGKSRRVFVNTIDEPEHLFEINFATLADFDTRLYNVIKNDPPETHHDNRKFWRSDMLSAELKSYLRILATGGRFFAGEGVTHDQMIALLDHENLNMSHSGRPARCVYDSINVKLSTRSPTAELEDVCELVCGALQVWGRLHCSMDSTCTVGSYSHTLSVDSTRANICFPPCSEAVDVNEADASKIVQRWPSWLSMTIGWIGRIHYRVSNTTSLSSGARDEVAFRILAKAVEDDPLSSLLGCRFDVPKQLLKGDHAKERLHGERFAHEIRRILNPKRHEEFSVERDMHEQAEGHESAETKAVNHQFATAIIRYATMLASAAPCCNRIFSGACATSDGKTAARKILAKSLKRHSVTVLHWKEEYELQQMKANGVALNPLVFPPHYNRKHVDLWTTGPMVLLSFDARLKV